MDITKELTHIGLCAGYGGIELGLKRVLPTLRTIALSEIEAFACANLVAKMEAGLMDPAPIWSNLKTFPWSEFRDKVDILSGGYPCQPFSAAGKRLGGEDPRHLWPFISAGIALMRPSLCFFENVEGHISLGLPDVIEDLGRLGYRTTWGIFSASECLDANGRTAPHQRKRVFIMAHRNGEGLQWQEWLRQARAQGASGGHPAKCGGAMAVASGIGGASGLSRSLAGHERITGVADNCGAQDIWPSRPGEPQHAWEPPRVVGNAEMSRCSQSRTDKLQAGINTSFGYAGSKAGEIGGQGGIQSLGNAADARQPQRGSGALGQPGAQQKLERPNCGNDNAKCKIEPALGGDIARIASGLGYAELCESCDNRTDELRLLGNGVVPATSALAFRTLLDELHRG